MQEQRTYTPFWGYRKRFIPIQSKGIASLQVLSRIKVNVWLDDQRCVERLNIPKIIKKWLNEFYDMDNSDKLLATKFNAKSHSKGSKLKMERYYTNKIIYESREFNIHYHLQSCLNCKHAYKFCACPDLLSDPGRIFDNTPCQIPIDDRVWYFEMLLYKHCKMCSLERDKHFDCCNRTSKCPCWMAIRNPEFFLTFRQGIDFDFRPRPKFESCERNGKIWTG